MKTMRNIIYFNNNTCTTIEGSNAVELYRQFKKATTGLNGWRLDKPILTNSLKKLRNDYMEAKNMPNFNQVQWVKENIIFDEYTNIEDIIIEMFLKDVIFKDFDSYSDCLDNNYNVGDISFNQTKLSFVASCIPLNKNEIQAEKFLWENEAPASSFTYYLTSKYSIEKDILIRMNKGGQRMKA